MPEVATKDPVGAATGKPVLVIVTTVPETLKTILRGQPRFLGGHFRVSLVSSPGEDAEAVAQHEGVPVHAVSMRRGISPLRDAVSLVSMVILLLRLRPQIVHSYTPKAGLVTMLAAWICRVPVRVHTFTGLIFPSRQGAARRLLMVVDRLICACATCVVPEGNGVRRDLLDNGITRKDLAVIGSGNIAGVDTRLYSPEAEGVSREAAALRRHHGIPPDAFVFCYVGRLHREKGITELFAAFRQMPGEPWLLLAGAHDVESPVPVSDRHFMEAHPRVCFLGFQGDVRPVLAAADVMVLPSYREGFPNVVLQAGSMRRPVIATDINGCNEIVEPGLNGWLVPARDTAALTDAMMSAMSCPAAARTSMGEAARDRVMDSFEQQGHWRRMLGFYDGCLARA